MYSYAFLPAVRCQDSQVDIGLWTPLIALYPWTSRLPYVSRFASCLHSDRILSCNLMVCMSPTPAKGT